MKRVLYVFNVFLLTLLYISCNREDYSIHRLPAPSFLSATRGDTSVFLKWDKVNGASFYTLVRGYDIIKDSLLVESFEDIEAPDTMTEYRIYAVDDLGWRSFAYASDSGYVGIPDGIIPRLPQKIEASEQMYGCFLSWSSGRFATSYMLYKNGEFYKEVLGTEFLDYEASLLPTEYTLYSNNHNGVSEKGLTVVGNKGYFCIDDYEKYKINSVIHPWTDLAERTKYYTEGEPKITDEAFFSGAKSMVVKSGKIEVMHDWGGSKHRGYYVISFMARKPRGSFTIYSSFGTNEVYSDVSEWTKFSFKTGWLDIGATFKLGIESRIDSEKLFIDDFSIEYIYSEPEIE